MKKKILLFTDSLGGGGAQRQLVGLAKLLNKLNYEISVVTYYPYDFFKKELDENNIHNILLIRGIAPCRRIITFYKYVKSYKPDCIISYQETPSLIACLIKLFGLSFKLIVSERNTTQKLLLKDRLRFVLYRFCANYVVPNSFSQTNFILQHYPSLSVKTKPIINFVDLKYFCPSSHIFRDEKKIIVVASVWEPKNTLNFIEACRILNMRGLKYKVEWYGVTELHSEYINKCMSKIQLYSLENVSLLPKTQDIKKKYQDADFLCLPSFYEGTPNVICEAISTGLPVVCSNVCDNSIYVRNNINGYLFDPYIINDIADKIQLMLGLSKDTFEEFAENSRQIAEEMLGSDMFIEKYINLID